jgi:hypothetical protein
VFFADEAADSGCRELLQPFASEQSARHTAAAEKQARRAEGDLGIVDLNSVSSAIPFVHQKIGDTRYT